MNSKRFKFLIKKILPNSIFANQNEAGFTLIELLVVISIIGILSTLLLSNLQGARARARDVQRKSDLKQVKTALRMYYNDNQSYPSGSGNIGQGCDGGSCDWGTSLFGETGGTVYMKLLPQDPLGSPSSYYYHQIDSDSFNLYACLENKSDSSGGSDCGSLPSCSTDWCFKVSEE